MNPIILPKVIRFLFLSFITEKYTGAPVNTQTIKITIFMKYI